MSALADVLTSQSLLYMIKQVIVLKVCAAVCSPRAETHDGEENIGIVKRHFCLWYFWKC